MLNDVSVFASTDRDGPTPTRKAARVALVMMITIATALGAVADVALANVEGISDHDFVIDWSNPTKGIDTGAPIADGDDDAPFGVRLLQDEFSAPVAEPLEAESQLPSAPAKPVIPAQTTQGEVGSKSQPQRFGFNARFFTIGDFEYSQARLLMPPLQESSGNPIELTEEHSARVFRFAF